MSKEDNHKSTPSKTSSSESVIPRKKRGDASCEGNVKDVEMKQKDVTHQQKDVDNGDVIRSA